MLSPNFMEASEARFSLACLSWSLFPNFVGACPLVEVEMGVEAPMTDNRPKRRRLTLSVGMMMVLILMLCLWLGRQANKAHEQRNLLTAVSSHGGWAHFDYEFTNGKLTPGGQLWAPSWLRRTFGDEY